MALRRITFVALCAVGATLGLAVLALPVAAVTRTTAGSVSASGGSITVTPPVGVASPNAAGTWHCYFDMVGNWTFYETPVGPTIWGISGSADCTRAAQIGTTVGLLYDLKPTTQCNSGANDGQAGSFARSSCALTSPVGAGVWTMVQQTYIHMTGIGTSGFTVTPGSGEIVKTAILTANEIRVRPVVQRGRPVAVGLHGMMDSLDDPAMIAVTNEDGSTSLVPWVKDSEVVTHSDVLRAAEEMFGPPPAEPTDENADS